MVKRGAHAGGCPPVAPLSTRGPERAARRTNVACHARLDITHELGEFIEIELAVGVVVVRGDEAASVFGAEVDAIVPERRAQLAVVEEAAAVDVVTVKRREDARREGGAGRWRLRMVGAAALLRRTVYPCRPPPAGLRKVGRGVRERVEGIERDAELAEEPLVLGETNRVDGELLPLQISATAQHLEQVERRGADVQRALWLDHEEPNLTFVRDAVSEERAERVPPLGASREEDELL